MAESRSFHLGRYIAPLICLKLTPAFADPVIETELTGNPYTKTLSWSADNSTDYIYTGFGETSGDCSSVSLNITGLQASSSLLNSGNISVTATGGTATDSADAYAYGMSIYGDTNLTNTGIITAAAFSESGTATAYELYISSGTTASDAYNTYSVKQFHAEHKWDFFLVPFVTRTSSDASPVG